METTTHAHGSMHATANHVEIAGSIEIYRKRFLQLVLGIQNNNNNNNNIPLPEGNVCITVYQPLYVDTKPNNYFLRLVDDHGAYLDFPLDSDEFP